MADGGWKEKVEFCRQLPKIELHAHLNGSIPDATLLELAREGFTDNPSLLLETKKLTEQGKRTLAQTFRLFDIIHKLTTDHATITRITRDVVKDFAADNVCYLELRTTPKNNPALGMTKASYLDAVLEGMKEFHEREETILNNASHCSTENGQVATAGVSADEVLARHDKACESGGADHSLEDRGGGESEEEAAAGCPGIVVRLILSIDRREGAEAAMDTVKLALKSRERGVVGIDLSGNPSVGTWATFVPALKLAREGGLPLSIHCGEVPNPEEIASMLAMCPERVGHVCCVTGSEWDALLASSIPVEVCLTSNVRTESVPSYDDHHFQQLYEAKHPIVICTDDSGVFSTSLSKEYAHAAAAFGLSNEQLFGLACSPVDFIFEGEGVKVHLRKIFAKTQLERRVFLSL